MIIVDGGDVVELGHRSSEDEGDDGAGDDVREEEVDDDEMWNDSVEYLDEVGVKIGVTGFASNPSTRELMVMMTAAAVAGRNSFHHDGDFASP